MRQRGNRRFHFCVFPGYNWCGPGCNGPGLPINDVDVACKAHDDCYRRGRNLCECDQEFLNHLHSNIDPYTKKGRHARLLYNYMKIQTALNCNFYR